MAYKFQFGPAVLSGSLTQEGTVVVKTDAGVTKGHITTAGEVSGSDLKGHINAAALFKVTTANLVEGANLYYTDVRARASNTVSDAGGDGSLAYNNSTGVFTYTGPSAAEARAHISVTDAGGDGSAAYNSSTGVILYTGPSAGETRAHFSAGAGLDYSAGVYNIGTAEVVDAMLNDDVAAGLAGGGISAGSGVMAVEISGALKLGAGASGKLGMSGSMAGIALDYFGGADSILGLDVKFDNSSIGVTLDKLVVKDLGVTVGKMANLADGHFLMGNGSARPVAVDMTGDVTMNNAGLSAIGTDKIKDTMVDWGTGGSQISTADIPEQTNLFFTNERVDDQVNALCVGGAGITITYDDGAGTLTFVSDAGSTTPNGINAAAAANLIEGTNFGTTTLTEDVTWTLPGSPSLGDIVRVKSPANLAGFDLTVLKGSADHRIDGVNSIQLEAAGSAINLIWLAANTWGIF